MHLYLCRCVMLSLSPCPQHISLWGCVEREREIKVDNPGAVLVGSRTTAGPSLAGRAQWRHGKTREMRLGLLG